MLKSTIEEIKKKQSLSLVMYYVHQNQMITPGSDKIDPESVQPSFHLQVEISMDTQFGEPSLEF